VLWFFQKQKSMIRYKKDTDNIVTLTLDMKDRAVNIINYEIGKTFIPVIQHLKEEKAKGALRGVIITSAKSSFLAGGDIDFLYQSNDAQAIYDYSTALTKFMRDLESPGVPVVAAINGTALGSGFELSMACHHRVVINDPKIELGYPEVTLGLMPGSGGVIRLMWLMGIEKAFRILSHEHRYSPTEALEAGIIDALAVDEDDLIDQARDWLLEHREGRRVWDTEGGKIPFGTANDLHIAQKVRQLAAELSKSNYNNFQAPQAILNCLAEGSKVDFDTACRIQSRYFTNLMMNKQSKNMMKAFWYELHEVKSGISRPKGYGKFRPKKVGVIGAGVMGSAIAYDCLLNGMNVLLKDVSKPIADLGKQYSENRLMDLVKRNIITKSNKEELIKKINTTDSYKDFEDCDIVIEAVFESLQVKSKAIKDTEEYLDEFSVFGSNTTSIPISKLAQFAKRPDNYVGVHFIHPANEVPIVEVVKGKKTSEETVARAFDFVKALNKIPIIVKDYQGFYISRVQNTFILEAITMLQEGFSPHLIENLSLQSGMPKSGLALADDLSLPLIMEYEKQAADHYGDKYLQHPAVNVLEKMMNELDRNGKQRKSGFYEYEDNGTRRIWQALTTHFPTTKFEHDSIEIKERILFAQAIEAIWCLQEKVVLTEAEANLGSVYGWGFPAFHGGVIQFVYAYGIEAFIARCKEYEQKHGPRFKVPKWLLDKVQ
jgi:3-hydroxyacyl-CoA dehydrogenase/enoyl-CoA hydratase/3-hydroxybutyryl-CoA epimerase